MPKSAQSRLLRERAVLERQPLRAGETAHVRALRIGKLLFARADEILDRPANGPMHLHDAAAANVVEQSLLFGTPERYALYAWCVMANHVHALLTPRIELAKITQGIKGHTAREINRLQHAVGRVFWHDESYDHWIRDEEEFFNVIHYIENNPVKAGLCADASDWLWSSARLRTDWEWGAAYQFGALSQRQSG